MLITTSFIVAGAVYVGKATYSAIRKPKRNLVNTLLDYEQDYSILSHSEHELTVAADMPNELEMIELERRIDHNIRFSLIATGLATAGALFYPPLSLISGIFTLYTAIDIFQDIYDAVYRQRRIRAVMIEGVAIVGGLIFGAYFASALTNCTYHFGKKLVLKTENNTRKNLVDIFGESPSFVWRLIDGEEIEVPFEDLAVGDTVVVNAGEMIPVDGTITEGTASVDQRLLTGESQPAEKTESDTVFASTVVLAGRICIQVEKAGQETVTAQIGEILNQTTNYESSIESKAQMFADRSVIPTFVLSGLTWPILGPIAAVTVLYSNFTDPLRIAAPLGMLNYLTISSQRGILIKDGRALEMLKQVDTVVFDKTGTLTLEHPHVADVHPLSGHSKDELLTFAAAAEHRQAHPIAKAICQAAEEGELILPNIDEAAYEIGYGIKVNLEGKEVRVGSQRFMEMEEIAIPEDVLQQQVEAHELGYSFVYVAVDDQLGGTVELHPTLRPEAHTIIAQLRQRNLETIVISGDQEQPTRKLAGDLGIERYFAEVLPEDKANLVEALQQDGKIVCFVGDGINDSIALKKANVSISLSGASTIATDTAQIILMDGTLGQLDTAFEIATQFDGNLKGSLWATFGPSLLCVSGVFFFHFRILSAIILYNASLAAGVGNAMLPWFTERIKNEAASDA